MRPSLVMGQCSSTPTVAPNSVFNQVLNYEKRVASCNLDTLKKNGIAVGLDAASLGADAFGPEEQYAKLAIGLTLSTGSMINSAANHDMTGTGLGMASYLRAPTELAATSAGWGWAKCMLGVLFQRHFEWAISCRGGNR